MALFTIEQRTCSEKLDLSVGRPDGVHVVKCSTTQAKAGEPDCAG